MKLTGNKTKRVIFVLLLGYVIIFTVITLLFIGGVIGFSKAGGGGSGQSSPLFLYNETTFELVTPSQQGVANLFYPFTIYSNSVVQGAFVSTHGVDMYITPAGDKLNYQQYNIFSTGNLTSGKIFVTLGPGSYVFWIGGAQLTVTNVTITRAIEVIPTSLVT